MIAFVYALKNRKDLCGVPSSANGMCLQLKFEEELGSIFRARLEYQGCHVESERIEMIVWKMINKEDY